MNQYTRIIGYGMPTPGTDGKTIIFRTPTPAMINTINMLQLVASELGVAVALPNGYDGDAIYRASTELSSMIARR